MVELRDFLPKVVNVGLDRVRALEPQLTAECDAITVHHVGQTPNLPFQFRSDGLRLMSNYFAKLPLSMQRILFGPDGRAEGGLSSEPPESPKDTQATGGGTETGGRPGGFLSPFKQGADADYVSNVIGGPFRRGRSHETLVNDFANGLGDRGCEAASNAASTSASSTRPSLSKPR